MLESFPRPFSEARITTVTQLFDQPQCNRLAKLLDWIRLTHMNKAEASLMGVCQALNRLWIN